MDAQQLARNRDDYTNQLKGLRDRLKGDTTLDMASIDEAGLVVGDLKRAITNINDFYTA